MYFKENATLSVSNPILEDMSKPVTEALLSDIKIKEVRAIYPLVKAINSGRLTRNYTFYPAESLIGKNKAEDPTGYSSFVKPFGKPVLREHQAQKVMGMLGPIEEADVPMGRIVFSGFRRRQEKKDGPGTPSTKKYVPGTVEGDGTLYTVPAVTDPESITRILGGAYHTVSIGSRVDNVWEAISGKNIADIRRKGEELPPYERGQLYEGKLSYWRMGEIRGIELSFVNVPSDEYAGVVDPDIGTEGIRLLVAEKKSGKSNEYNFFDAKTAEKVNLDMDELAYDESFFVDSVQVGHDIWWLNTNTESVTESVEEPIQPEENEETDMAKGINLETATVVEMIEQWNKEKPALAFKELLLMTFKSDEDVTDLVEGKNGENIENAELFAEISDFATELCGDWDENAAKFALSLYLNKGGTLSAPLVETNEENSELFCGPLYLLNEDDENYNTLFDLSNKEIESCEDSVFCGPNRTFPITNKKQAIMALNSFENSKGDDNMFATICEKSRQFGVGSEEGTIVLYPLLVETSENKFVPLFTIRSVEELNDFIENLDTFAECYGLTDVQKEGFAENLSKAGDSFTEKLPESDPVMIILNADNLVHYMLNSEKSDSRKELVTLAGLVRKGKVSKSDLEDAYESYNVFGSSILRKFIENTPEKAVENDPAEETDTQDKSTTLSVETISDPVAVTEKSEDAGKRKESKDVWLGVRVRPIKRNGKNPVNIKEKS